MILAHGTVTPETFWSAWTWDPLVLLGLALAGWLYRRGLKRLGGGRTRAASPVRATQWSFPDGAFSSKRGGEDSRWGARTRRAASFYAALVVAGLALVSPLDALGESLFSAHMVQHLLLILVAAPLLVYGAPLTMMSLGLPVPARRMLRRAERSGVGSAFARLGRSAIVVLALHVVVLWLWHLPSLYEAALRLRWIHIVEHAAFLGTALPFWGLVIGGLRERRRLDHGTAILTVFANLLQSGALGAILVFATTELYPLHAAGAVAWDLSLLEDQQLAGAIMWVPASILYFATMAVLFLRWMKLLEDRPAPAATGGAHG